MKHIFIAGVVVSFLYITSFILRGGMFNIFFFTLKVLKYRIVHNITSFPGASLVLFLTGYFQTWWGRREFLSVNTWTFMWPAGFTISFFQFMSQIIKKRNDMKTFFAVLPLLYFVYLGVQAPFARYFLIILPFLYLNLAYISTKFFFKKKSLTRLLNSSLSLDI